jgi:Iap family predicted aminopeptidase
VDLDIKISSNDIENLNFFHMTGSDIERKIARTLGDIGLIKNPQKQKKLYCSRYLPALEAIEPDKKSHLIGMLEKYAAIIN